MQDGGKLRHYGIKNGFHLVLALSRIGQLQSELRHKDRVLWERDFEHYEDVQDCRALSFPSLIETVDLAHDPDRMGKVCKLAYLTEAQASACIEEMDHFVACLKLRRPKLILKFIGSYGDALDIASSYDPKHTQFPYVHCVPEVSVGDQSKVEEMLIAFARDCILELARNTNAIVIVEATINCGLGSAIRKVLGPVQEQMGPRCPFTLICITSAATVNNKSNIDYTNAQRIKHGFLHKSGKQTSWKTLDDMNERKNMASGPIPHMDHSVAPDDDRSYVSKELPKSNMASSVDLGDGVEHTGIEILGDNFFYEDGQKVEAQYYKFDKWYPGRIEKNNGNGTYVIQYDDGEKEYAVESKHIRTASRRGPKRIKGMKSVQYKSHECDLADGISHYFIIEGEENKHEFERRFLSVVTQNTPCLGFATYGNEDNLRGIADMCNRGLPLVLLDSRERYWTSPYIDVNETKTYLAQKTLSFDQASVARKLTSGLNLKVRERPYEDFFVAEQALKQHLEYPGAAGIVETYDTSTLSFLHAVLNPGKTTAPLDPINPRGTLKLYEAIRVAGKKRKLDAQRGTVDERNDIKRKLEVIMRMWDYTMRYNHAFIFHGIMPKLQWWVAPFAAPMGPNGRPSSRQRGEMPGANAAAFTRTTVNDKDGPNFGEKQMDGDIKYAELIDEENFGVPAAWVRDEESRQKYTPEGGPMNADPMLKEQCKALYNHLREWQGQIGEQMESFKSNPERVLNAAKALTCETVYSTSLFDSDAIHTVIKKVCDVDHLPDTTTYESMLLLRDAWDAVDVYSHLSMRYKYVTHFLNWLFLTMGIMIVGLTISRLRTRIERHQVYGQEVLVDDNSAYEFEQWFGKDQEEHDYILKLAVLGMSLIMLGTGSLLIMWNPQARWHGLRAAASATQSEIYKFRCRAGPYRTNFAQAHRRKKIARTDEEQRLRAQIVEVRQRVVASSLLKQANLNQKFAMVPYLHGQHAPEPGCCHRCKDCCIVYCSCCCNDPNEFEYHIEEGHSLMLPDFHFAPMRPKDYICHRVDKIMNFYSSRVPRYSRIKFTVITIIIVGSLCCVILAAMDYTAWAAVMASIILAIAAYSEYNGTNRKLNRYSTVITELKNLKTWWFSLGQEQQMFSRNCDKLVMMGEAIIADEQLAWASESKVQRVSELSERVRVRADYVDDNAPNPVEEGRPATGTSRAGGGDSSAGMGMSASAANFDDDE